MRQLQFLTIIFFACFFSGNKYLVADSLFVDFNVDTLNVCLNEPLDLSPTYGGGQAGYSFSWSNGDVGPQVSIIPTQGLSSISVIIQDQSGEMAYDTLIMKGFPECVFPGDANGDRLANNLDILALGESFAVSGAARPDAHFNWIGQPALKWQQNLPTGADYVHSDTDGNGVVNVDDLYAIDLNYSGPQTLPGLSPTVNGVPMYIEVLSSSFLPGDTIEAAIMLGTATQPVDSVYGIAFSVDYSAIFLEAENLRVDFSDSWMGTEGFDLIAQEKNFATFGQVDIGISRTNGQQINGFGRIATIIVVIDDISGKKEGEDTINFNLGKVSAFISSTSVLPIGPSGLSLGILLSNSPTFESLGVNVFPNPSNGNFSLTNGDPLNQIEELRLFNMIGKEIDITTQKSGGDRLSIQQVQTPVPGVYFLQAKINGQLLSKRLIIQ